MRILKPVAALSLAALLLSSPEASALGAAGGMAHWYASVAPALFPFLALMPLLTCEESTRLYARLLGPVARRLFRLPGASAAALAVGLLAGSPAGTLAARRIAAREGMDRGQLLRLSLAAAGFSPAFLVGGVGAGMLGSAALGWKLLLSQLLAQLALGTLLRGAWRGRTQPVPEPPRAAEEASMRAAVLTALTICGYMALFGAVCAALRARVGGVPADALLCLLDVPSGAKRLSALPLPGTVKPVLAAALCGFGGGCVAAQNLGAMRGCGVGAGEYLAARLLAAALEGGFMALLLRLPAVGEAWRGWDRPLTAAALAAALLALPVVAALRKSIS